MFGYFEMLTSIMNSQGLIAFKPMENSCLMIESMKKGHCQNLA